MASAPHKESRKAAVWTSMFASTARFWQGSLESVSRDYMEDVTLEFYEFEACPFCRLVREQITALQLDVKVYPCPQGGVRFRPKAKELAGGKVTFPFLRDSATGFQVADSKKIVKYLWDQYGQGKRAPIRTPVALLSSTIASSLRKSRGGRARTSKHLPKEMLILYSFESSPFSRLVREVLSEMEIPYILRSMGKEQISDIGMDKRRLSVGEYKPVEGGRREQLKALYGKVQVPCLVDPNQDQVVFDSRRIIRHLSDTYDPEQ